MKWMRAYIFITLLLAIGLVSCGKTSSVEDTSEEKERIVVGFSQLGAESDWRSANTNSMLETFTKDKGYELIVEDGQQSQTNQFMAIRKFIQQDVDYIVLAPVTEDGWDTVLQEAKEAGIPVVIVDRMVNVADSNLFTCWVGSDFELEGKKASEWLHHFSMAKNIAPQDMHIVNIQGTIGASAQIGRTNGLESAAKAYGWDLIAEESGDFTQTKGKEVMTRFLRNYDNINIVYCENDNSAFGAIEAIEAAGKKVGSDIVNGEIMVVSFDGVNKEAIQDVALGKISCIAECNPLHGPRVEAIISQLEKGVTPDKLYYVDEDIYSATDTVTQVSVEGKSYDVTTIDHNNFYK